MIKQKNQNIRDGF